MGDVEAPPISLDTHPDRYHHWKLTLDGEVATLAMDVEEDASVTGQVDLVLNSYDLGVDIELADAIQRLRFEHPEVRTVVMSSAKERIFCAGANIRMLAASTHPFKVNFCKFTNETRLGIEDASAHSGLKFLAALSGTASGGGYELALACDDILLVDDRNSAVSFPETPLLGVLPGTGGLTRLVDKRKIRPDLADFFSTTAEGVKGKRALKWGFVDAIAPLSRFEEILAERTRALVESVTMEKPKQGVTLSPLAPEITEDRWNYEHVSVDFGGFERTATLTIMAPQGAGPQSLEEIYAAGENWWALSAFRQLDDAIVRLRFNRGEVGTWLVKTSGSMDAVLAIDALLDAHREDWFVGQVRHHIRRTLKRFETSARSLFAIVDGGSAFAGTLFEFALASDRIYMLDDPDAGVAVALSNMNAGPYLMGNGLTRLQTRFLADPSLVTAALDTIGEQLETPDADDLGLVTDAPDDLDWDDTIRMAIEERVSMSPDALTGMEASLRFAGPETLETKIFGRLSAWQNWIFQRPNAVGESGALTLYGHPNRPTFDWRRT
jgi:benzoyl-CoA-dihydrodiol lyase